LLQSDDIEINLNDDLLSIQNLEDDFIQKSHQLASDLTDTEVLLSHLNDETVSDLRSVDNDTATNDELRIVQYDTTTDDEERSETPPPPLRSEHYDLRQTLPLTSILDTTASIHFYRKSLKIPL